MSKLTQRVQPRKAYTLPRHKTGPATWKLAVQSSRIWVANADSQAKKEEPRGLSRAVSGLLVLVNGNHHILEPLRVTGPSR